MGRSPHSSLWVLTDNEKLNTDNEKLNTDMSEQISWTEVTAESASDFGNW